MGTETSTGDSVDATTGRLWGPQTARALDMFPVGTERGPRPLIRGIGIVLKALAMARLDAGAAAPRWSRAVIEAAEEMIDGAHDRQFPFPIWRSGDPALTTITAAEVVATRARRLLGDDTDRDGAAAEIVLGDADAGSMFHRAFRVALAERLTHELIPSLQRTRATLRARAGEPGVAASLAAAMMTRAETLAEVTGAIEATLAALAPTIAEATDGLIPVLAPRLAEITGLETLTTTTIGDEVLGPARRVHIHLERAARTLINLALDPELLEGRPPGAAIQALVQVCARVVGNEASIAISVALGRDHQAILAPVAAYACLRSVDLLATALTMRDDLHSAPLGRSR